MTIKPLLLKGHSKPLTHIQFNREGDLLFSCAKDDKPTVWYATNGERWGTYNGHKGAVWHLDVNFDSSLLLTAGADQTARLWDVETGMELAKIVHESAVRCVNFAEGDRMMITVGDKAMGKEATIFIWEMDKHNVSRLSDAVPMMSLAGHKAKICRALWGQLNETIISASDDCTVRLWDVETGQEIARNSDHELGINNLKLYNDKSMCVTSSKDYTARLLDCKTLECLKVYKTEQPVNDAVISSLKPHVILGGGQEAMSVAQTSTMSGRFESHFYHLYYEEWLGAVKGHFGPINAMAVSHDGKAYASAAEDGYVRIYHFDSEYLRSEQ